MQQNLKKFCQLISYRKGIPTLRYPRIPAFQPPWGLRAEMINMTL